jgi:hypothetical protein
MSTELGSCYVPGKGRDLIDTPSQQRYRKGAAFGRTHNLPESRADCNIARRGQKEIGIRRAKKKADGWESVGRESQIKP